MGKAFIFFFFYVNKTKYTRQLPDRVGLEKDRLCESFIFYALIVFL